MLTQNNNQENQKRQLRQFGLSLTLALAVLGSLFFIRRQPAGPYFLGLSLAAFVLTATGAPLLRPVQKLLTLFGRGVGWLITNVILIGLFYLVITPMALLGRLWKKGFLDTNCDQKATTYWETKPPRDPSSLEQQF
ncbi:MAG: SxtJ family membrane protein [Candidatus Omnitrophota bacterium]